MKLKVWINVITFGALAVLVYISRHQFEEVFSKLGTLSLLPLLLLIPLKFFNFYTIAKMYQEYFAILGEKVSTKELFKVAMEMNFVNLVFPSGGASGFSYMSIRLKPLGVSTAKTTMVQAARFGLVFLTFLILIFVGMFILAVEGKASNLTILIASSISMLTLFGTGIILYVVSSKERITSFTAFLPRGINRIARFFHRKQDRELIKIDKVRRVFEELHDDYNLIARDFRKLNKTAFWALMINVSELVLIYMVFVAHGEWINVGALIIAYAVANFAGLVSLFGGLGVYEFLMTSVMASAGVPAALALSATVMYRVINMVVFLPIGYWLYRKFLQRSVAVAKEDSLGRADPHTN